MAGGSERGRSATKGQMGDRVRRKAHTMALPFLPLKGD
jgi:hypothetical protein